MKIRFTLNLVFFFLTTIYCFNCFAQISNKPIEVPFDFYHNEIILQVKINNKTSLNMMLDTGTDPSVVDLKTAKEIGLKLDLIGQPATGGGTESNLTYATELPLIEIGGLKAKKVEALAIDLSKISESLGKPIHGILGHSLLNNRIVQIDYPKKIVRFFSKSPFLNKASQSNASERTILSFRYDDNILIDDIFVNEKKMTANFDTGSNGSFKLTPAAVSELGLSDEVEKAQPSNSVGYNGVSPNREGKIKNVTIGKFSVEEPTVVFFGKGTGRDKKPWGINIGNVFLKDFLVTIDYPGKTITLEKP